MLGTECLCFLPPPPFICTNLIPYGVVFGGGTLGGHKVTRVEPSWMGLVPFGGIRKQLQIIV